MRDSVARHKYSSSRPTFKIDTYEKAMRILDAIAWSRHAYKKLDYMFEEYPELIDCTHQHIAEIMRMQRETVTRAMKVIAQKKLHHKYKRAAQAACLMLVLLCSQAFAETYVISAASITSAETFTAYCIATATTGNGAESGASNEVSKLVTGATSTLTLSWDRVFSYTDNTPVYVPQYTLYCGATASTYTSIYSINLGKAIRAVGTGPKLMQGPQKTLHYLGQ